MKPLNQSSDKIFDAMNTVFLTVFFLAAIYPLYFVLIASVSDIASVGAGNIVLLPQNANFDGYRKILGHADVWLGYKNTIFYTLFGTTLNIILTLSAGYALSRKDLKGRTLIMGIFAFTMYFGGGMVPTYFLVKSLGLLDTPLALILPTAMSVWNLIIARTYFSTSIPDELLEAAKIDGCSDFKFFGNVAMPLSKSITAVLILYYAVGHWNAYFDALMYMTSRNLFPLQLFLREMLIQSELTLETLSSGSEAAAGLLNSVEAMKYGLIVVASVPVLILYPFVQKYFIKGVMIGALKG